MSLWTFIRHGQSVANRDGWLAGHVDTPLTSLGIAQATRLRPELNHSTIERVFCSDLSRALDTARLVTGLSTEHLIVDPELRERHLGDWEHMKRTEAFSPENRDRLLSWDQGPPGGESRKQVTQRVLRRLHELGTSPSTLLVAHGTLLSCILGLLDGIDVTKRPRFSVPNATPFVQSIEPGQWADLLKKVG